MKIYRNPQRAEWEAILERPVFDTRQLETAVQGILDEVRTKGDAAIRLYTARFDGVDLADLAVGREEIDQAIAAVPESLKQAIRQAAANIRRFHEAQREESVVIETMPGVRCWRRQTPIEKVGLYIPGGTAPLFSTVLMLGIPAKIAGCREIVLCSPPDRQGRLHPAILFAADLVGVTRIYKAGGVQAIGGMAYGTDTIPRVYKIFGPGNQYVTAAKQLVSRTGTSIDMPAGPSEVLVCADHTADPEFVAADLLSQAEHGADSQVVLVAFSEALVTDTLAAIERQLEVLPRAEIARQALDHSVVVIVPDRTVATDLINAYAPEHLILSVEEETDFAAGIVNAGSVFLGNFTPESVGDYASGTNHTLPTNGYARTFSGVSLDSFVKMITYQQLTPEGLSALGPVVEAMAEAEALEAHRNAVSIRLRSLG